MFTIEIDRELMQITMKNCGPITSGHHRYGDRIYRRISEASWRRICAWADNGHWVSRSGDWWLNVCR